MYFGTSMPQTNIWELTVSTVYMYRLQAIVICVFRILPVFKKINKVSVIEIGADSVMGLIN